MNISPHCRGFNCIDQDLKNTLAPTISYGNVNMQNIIRSTNLREDFRGANRNYYRSIYRSV